MNVLDEYEAREYLGGRFTAFARAKLARTEAEAVRLAETLGWPVVAKASVRGVGHKSDFKGVAVNLRTPAELQSACAEIRAAAEKAGYAEAFRGFLIEEQLKGAEFILGAIRDPAFGPVVMVGSGGVLAELVRDTVFRLAPLTREEAERAILATKASKFLKGFRGSGPLPIEPLAQAMVELGDLIAGNGEIEELDINPFILGSAAWGAADALVRLK